MEYNIKEICKKTENEILGFVLENPDKEKEVLDFLKNNTAFKSKFFSVSALIKDGKQNSKGIGALKAELLHDVSKTDIKEIKIDLLIDNPYQPRIEINEEGIVELANTINIEGLQSPIKVTPTEDGKYIIVFGHRRTYAHKYLGLDTIKAFVEKMDDKKLRRLALIENIQREELTLIEKALSYKNALVAFDFSTQKELAKELGLAESKISESLSILKLDDRIIKDLAKNKKIKDTTALALINKLDAARQYEVYLLLAEGKIDREGVRQILKGEGEVSNSQCESSYKNNKVQMFFKTKIKDKNKQEEFKEFVEERVQKLILELREKEKMLVSGEID